MRTGLIWLRTGLENTLCTFGSNALCAVEVVQAKPSDVLNALQLDNKVTDLDTPRADRVPNNAVSRQAQQIIDPSGNHGNEPECQTYTSRVNMYILTEVSGRQLNRYGVAYIVASSYPLPFCLLFKDSIMLY